MASKAAWRSCWPSSSPACGWIRRGDPRDDGSDKLWSTDQNYGIWYHDTYNYIYIYTYISNWSNYLHCSILNLVLMNLIYILTCILHLIISHHAFRWFNSMSFSQLSPGRWRKARATIPRHKRVGKVWFSNLFKLFKCQNSSFEKTSFFFRALYDSFWNVLEGSFFFFFCVFDPSVRDTMSDVIGFCIEILAGDDRAGPFFLSGRNGRSRRFGANFGRKNLTNRSSWHC